MCQCPGVPQHGFLACYHYRTALMMRAKTLHPRNSTSRCSKREQRRRHPCNRRTTRTIAVRRLSSSRADARGLTRLRRGGPTGAYPSATARGRGWAPADARSTSPREERGADPGESATDGPPGRRGRARASARRRAPGGHPRPPDAAWGATRLGSGRGMEDRLCARPRAGGRDLGEGAVERPGRPREAHALFSLQMRKDPVEHAGLRPAVAGCRGGGPGAKAGRQPAPCAALRGDRPEGGEHGARGEADRAARPRERGCDPGVWSWREVHPTRRPEACA